MSYIENTLAPAWRSFHTLYAAQRAQVSAWYQRLNPRERRLVLGLAAFVVATLVWLILIDPAWSNIRSTKAALPTLRTQAASVADIASRVSGLKRSATTHTQGTLPAETELKASLQQAGMKDEEWSLQPPADDGKSLTIKLSQAHAETMLRWLDNAPRDWQLIVSNVELTRSRDADKRRVPGRFDGTITLAVRPPAAH
jgi:general secretion pathway protein M